MMLSIGGGMVGLAGGIWLVRLIESSKQLPIPRQNPVQVDRTVLLFTFALSVLVGIIFGLAPAFQAAKTDLGEELKSTSQTVVSASRVTRLLRDGLFPRAIRSRLAEWWRSSHWWPWWRAMFRRDGPHAWIRWWLCGMNK